MALAELNAKAIQFPAGEGKPAQRASDARKAIADAESKMESNQKNLDDWATTHGSDLVIAEEYLQREDAIFTSPTSLAVSNQALPSMLGFRPTTQKTHVRNSRTWFHILKSKSM